MNALYNLIVYVAQDADPTTPGYQASIPYVVLCLLVPIALGALVSALVTVLEKWPEGGRSHR